ncbi:Multidrug resistance-associated protein 1, partial [Pseudolycoriella hygida]
MRNVSLTWVDTSPDFTDCFKQTILVWAPCTFLLFFAPFDLYYRFTSRYADIPWSFLNISKFVTLFLLICLTFVDVGIMLSLRGEHDTEIFDSQIVTVLVKAATFMIVTFLQAVHKIKGHSTSGLLFLFWLTLVVFAIPQLRSEIQKNGSENLTKWAKFQFINYVIYFVLISKMLLMNCLADKEPRTSTFVVTKVNKPSPEQRSSFINQILFEWFTPIMRMGYRRPLTEADIFDINPENTARELIPPFDKYFAQSLKKGRRQLSKEKKKVYPEYVTKSTLKTTNGSVIPAIIQAYGLPFLFAGFLQLIIIALLFAQPFLLDELITFTSVADTSSVWRGLALSFGLFFVTFLSAIVNGQFFCLMSSTGLRIKTGLICAIYRKALRISIGTKKDTTVGEIFNLMSVDALRFNNMMNLFHDVWSGPVIMGIAIWLLYRILGVSVFAGLAVLIFMVPASGVLCSNYERLLVNQMGVKDERVKSMNEILAGIKVLKLYAWEPSFEEIVTSIRAEEMKLLKTMAVIDAASIFLWELTPALVALVSYVTFVLLGVPMILAYVVQVAVSLKRINKFMNSEEMNPHNVTKNSSENALSVENGNFTWGGESTTLKNINIKVRKQTLVALVGPVGCGKTSLLSALLGEMEKIDGTVNIDGRIAYVPQQAWIQNATLQENILFGRPLNEEFYDKVIHACALTPDLEMLPGGDQTEIGERGINLSGGQKQRIALARAVYSEADIYLLDDPLSAVDSHVGKHIFNNVFDENTGLLRGKCRLLVTHAVVYLPKVNEIYAMMNGEITESGSYRELLARQGAFAEFLMEHIQEIDDEEVKLMLKRSISTRSSQLSTKSSLNGSMKRCRNRRVTDESEKENEDKESARDGRENNSRLIDEEEAACGSVGFAVYIRYCKSIGTYVCVAAVVLTALRYIASVYSNVWLTKWSTDTRATNPNDFLWRNIYIGVYAGLVGVQGVTVLAVAIMLGFGCLLAARDLHKRLLHNNVSLTWVDKSPDFTDCFKQTILVWAPCTFLLFFAPFDLYYRFTSRYANIPWSFLNISKFVTLFLLICLTFVDLGIMLSLRREDDTDIFESQIVTVSVKAATFMIVTFLQAVHKIKGHSTSGLLFLFWLTLVVFAIPQLRSEIQKNGSENLTKWAKFQFINYVIYFVLISKMLLMNCLADKEPRTSTFVVTKVNKPSPEQRSSFINQILFEWFTPIMRMGYKRPLTEADIFDINPENTARELIPPFDKYFAQSLKKGRRQLSKEKEKLDSEYVTKSSLKTTNGSVIPTIIQAYGLPFLFAGFLQLIIIALLFAQPFLLDELINYTSVADTSSVWQGLVLSFGLFFVTFFSAIVNGQHFYLTSLTGLRIKTGLICAIYRKALRISIGTKKDTTVGEIFNLMSVDAQRFNDMMHYFHDVWSGPVIMGIAIWFLYRILGVAVFAGLGVMIFMIPVSGVIYTYWEKLQVNQMAVKDERVKSMNEILSGIKVLKLYAWEPSFEKIITSIRAEELKSLKTIAVLDAGSNFSWEVTPALVALVSYVTFVLLGVPMILAYIIQVAVSLKRINKFMNSEEMNPHNVTNNSSENALSVENGNFTWGGGSMTLKNINIKVRKQTLVALVGPVGCGKTSLLSALLGEMEKIDGTVNVDGRIAYVPQQAWIQNATLQDNILFGRPLNEETYKKVIHACALTPDLEMLPAGDQTEIGEKGINLSGGQKQRVALARAVYSEADIYLLDDPLSAVDSHVGKHIFNNVFDENTGLLRGKCRLLVTHAVVYLPKVSEIYVMMDSEITESGSYRKLLEQNGAFAEFLMEHIQEIDDEEVKVMLNRSISTRSSQLSKKSSLNGSMKLSRSRRVTEKSEKENEEKQSEKEGKANSKLVDEEEAASGSVGIAVYIRYCKSIGAYVCVAALILTALRYIASVYSNVWLTKWSTDTRATNPNDFLWRNIYIGVYAGLVGVQGVSVLAVAIILGFGCLRAARDLHERLLHNVMRLALSFFDTTPSGRILNRFSNDINVIDYELPTNMQLWLIMAFNVVAILVVISYSTPWFLVVVVPITATYYFIQVFFVATLRQLKRLQSITLSPIYNHFRETINGQSSIRAYGEVNRFVSENFRRVDHKQAMSYPGIIAHGWLAVRLEGLGAVIVLFASLFAVLAGDTVDPAAVGLSISYALQISQTLSFLVNLATEVETNIVAIERVNEYANRKQEAPWKTVPVDPTWPQKGVVKFVNFQVRYREGLDLVLKGINFSVNSQEKVGIVGRTGAGKSSLTLSLFRIIEAAGGKIIIDDINIAEIGLHSLRSQLTIIPQDPVLFSGMLLGLRGEDDTEIFDSQIVTVLAKTATFIVVVFLQAIHKIKGHSTSGLLFLFWLTLAVFATPQLRSEIQNNGSKTLTSAKSRFINYVIYFVLISKMLLMNCFADKEPRTSKFSVTKISKPSPEQRSSFLNQILFEWFTPIMWMGYKRPLTEDDIFDLNPENTSRELIPPFDKYFSQSVKKGRRQLSNEIEKVKLENVSKSSLKTTNGSVIPTIIQAYGLPFLFAGFLQLIIIALLFAQPFLLDELINFTSVADKTSVWQGLVLSFGLFFVTLFSAIVNGQFFRLMSSTGLRIKTGLICAIYRKALRISVGTKRDTTVGEIFNLMSVDAQRFNDEMRYFHDVWSGPVTMGIAIWLLYRILDPKQVESGIEDREIKEKESEKDELEKDSRLIDNVSLTRVDTGPDFTECFKQTILVWVPCAFLLFSAPFDLYHRLNSRYDNIPWSFLNISKFVTLFLLIYFTFVDLGMMLGLRGEHDTDIFDSQIVTVLVKAATFIIVAFLQGVHKIKGHSTSGLLFLFWLTLVVFAIPQLRSEIQNNGSENLTKWAKFQFIHYIIYFVLILKMLLMNCLADKEPRTSTFVVTKVNKPSPEQRSSFLSQILFEWFTPIMRMGYRRPLTEDDIFDIKPENTSRELIPRFDKYFAQSMEKGRRQLTNEIQKAKLEDVTESSWKTTNGSVILTIIQAYGLPFLFAGFLQLITIALLFAQPFLLDELINFTSVADTSSVWRGLVLSFGLFSVTFLSAIVNGQHFYLTSTTGLKIKTGLISAIYRKALRMSVGTKKDITVGEVFNLMSVDAQRFNDDMRYFHDVWSGPVIMGIAIWLLYRILGVAVFAGLGVMILMIPVSAVIYTYWEKLQVNQMAVKDERVKSMNEILSGIKVLKLYAWEPSFEKIVTSIRAEELKSMKTMAVLDAGSNFSWDVTPPIVALVSYVTFVLLGVPMILGYIVQVAVSLKRINKFMNSEEMNPHNVTNNPSENALSVEDGNFTWGGESTTLKNINIKVKKEQLVALVGPVGCGKTSLLSALLGEMEKIDGTVNVDGRIAYVPQQAWIQNATLQDNILFGRPLNEEFYKKVIDACALTPDLEMLPAGDQTEIGERGINLSGGQKQRVALARAVYSEADIYLLDDPLSAVDSHVGKHIFSNVFDENTGLLRGKCRLLVTHAVVYLPKVSEIYVMMNGEITESGSYRELLEQNGAFAEFLTQHNQEIEDDENAKQVESGMQDHEIKEKENEEDEEEDDPGLIDAEEAATGSVGISVYMRYSKSIGVYVCVAAVAITALRYIASVYSNVWLTKWSTDTRATNPHDFSWRNIYIGVYAGLAGVQGVSVLAVAIILGFGCLRAARDLHERLLHNVMRLALSFFDTTPSGRILNRFSNDINVIDNELPRNVQLWLIMAFNVVAILVVVSYSTPWFLVVVVPITASYYFIQVFFVATLRQLKRLQSITLSPIYNNFRETINGQSSIRAYGEVNRFVNENYRRVDHNQAMLYPGTIANGWLIVRLESLGAVVVLFASLFAVLGRHTLDPAIVGLSISYALQISQTLNLLVSMATEVETNIVAIERVNEYANRKQEAPWKTVPVDPTWPQKGVVKFENFQVRYREGLDLVLKGINFSVNSQEKVGIVGRTGAGKSSLTLSLFRIIEAAGGKITIDDINIAEIGLHSLRSQLTIIPQDPVLFSGSLRMNIDPFKSYTDDAIWIALEHSHLKTFVKGLSEGLDYTIAEGGENLSVGQRQLVCLARALLRKTKVLILDEATAAVDIETDELIHKTIRTQFSDCTILTIAHRLNTILDSDRVLVLDQGQIAEYDTPKALLENKDSIFCGMAKDAGITSVGDAKIVHNEGFGFCPITDSLRPIIGLGTTNWDLDFSVRLFSLLSIPSSSPSFRLRLLDTGVVNKIFLLLRRTDEYNGLFKASDDKLCIHYFYVDRQIILQFETDHSSRRLFSTNKSVAWVDTKPDFTECFKQTIAVWVPCAFFLFFLPFDLYCRSKSRYADIPWSFLNITKFATLLMLTCQAFYEMGLMLGLRDAVDVDIYDSQIASASLKAATFIFSIFLQAVHKVKGQATSGLLFLFSLISVVFAIPQLVSDIEHYSDVDLTAWMEFQFINHLIYFTLISLLLLLNCFADKEPRISTYAKTTSNKTSPEQRSSFLNRILFQWFSPILWIGYKRPLTEDDLFDIHPENTSRELIQSFDKYFAESIETKRLLRDFLAKALHVLNNLPILTSLGKISEDRKKFESDDDTTDPPIRTNGSVTPAIIRAYGKPFFFASFLKLILISLLFIQPFLLNELIDFISLADTSPVWHGFLLTFGLFSVTLISAIVNGQYVYLTKLTGLRVKTALMSALYRKALRISTSAKKATTFGKIFNLMSVDAQRFESATYYMNNVWSSPVIILIALCLLYRTIGVAVFDGIAVLILTLPLNAGVYSQIKRLLDEQMYVRDERIKSMNEILSGMKALKLYAWEPSFEDHVLNTREEELNIIKNVTIVRAGLPIVITHVVRIVMSLRRINTFMNSEEINVHDVTNNPSENALSVANGNFTWGGESMTLKNINMKVKKETLVALVGPVGCGKTSLLSALLGEMEKIDGTVNVDGRIAYVPQQAWIQNATLRNNILFGRPLNEEFYKKVIHACALTPDLEMLPAGDQTEIGEKGINLSGGQKQRVALARAVYSEADIYLLDDPLSAVDSHVGKHIFSNVFDENTGLLRGKCRLLVTHALMYLPEVSEVVVMVKGELVEKGSYGELLARKGVFAEFLTQPRQKNDASGGSKQKVARIGEKDAPQSEGDTGIANGENDQENMSKLIEEGEAAAGHVDIGVYIRFCKSVGTFVCIFVLIVCILKEGCAACSYIWLSKWCSDKRATATNLDDVSFRSMYIAVYATLITTEGVLLLVSCVILGFGCLRAARDLHKLLLHNVMRMGLSFFDTAPSGRILNRFSNDINVIDNELLRNMQLWLIMAFNVVAILVVISYSTLWFLVVVVPISTAYYFIQVFFVATSRQLNRLQSKTLSPVYNHFRETINGQSSIRAYGEVNRFVSENYSKVDDNQTMSYPGVTAHSWLVVRLEALGAVIILFSGLFAVLARHTLEPATVGLSISYALQISKAIIELVNLTSELQSKLLATERVNEYTICQREAPWKTVAVDPTWPQKGVIKFENFQVRYREGLDLVLKGINFSVNSQEKVGIVDRTGTGKSSLTLSLFRIIEAAGGKIIIDDINIAEIGLHSLRSQLTIIPQDPVLFTESITHNITVSNIDQHLVDSFFTLYFSLKKLSLPKTFEAGSQNRSKNNDSITWVDSDTIPDLTECFKQTILVWVPCAFFLFFFPFELYFRFNSRNATIPWSFLNVSKFVITFQLISLTFYEMTLMLGLRDVVDVYIYDSQIVSISLKAATFVFVAFLQMIHKVKGEITSGLMFIFWLLSVICAIPQLFFDIQNYSDEKLTTWRQYQFINNMIYFTLISILLFLHFFADKEPQTLKNHKTKSNKRNPKNLASFPNKMLFQWLTPLMRLGYRRPLTDADIFDIDPEKTSRRLAPTFDKYFAESVLRRRLSKAFHLYLTILLSIKKRYNNWKNIKSDYEDPTDHPTRTQGSIIPAIIKTYGAPFFFAGFLEFVYILLLFAEPFLLDELIDLTFDGNKAPLWQGILLTFTFFFVQFIRGIINSQCVYLVSVTGLRIHAGLMSAIYRKWLRLSTCAKKSTSMGEVVNLMTVDALRFHNEMIDYVHNLWSAPLTVGIAIWLLYRMLGVSVFVGLIVMVAIIPLNGVLYTKWEVLQDDEMNVKDERVKSMSQILGGMKLLKLYAWEPSFEKLISNARARELGILKKIVLLNAGTHFLWQVSTLLVSFGSYISFVLLGGKLTPNIVFVSLTLFTLINHPLQMLPVVCGYLVQVVVSIKRINKFMNSEEMNPHNVTSNPSENALSIENGNFTWGGESMTLKNINIKVKKEKLVSLVGPVGCGKTSLLCALLNEMERIDGTVNVDGRIAYVPQQAWIQNATLQDNILFGRPLNEEFYKKVIYACALTPDLEMLPAGDQTEIGEKGINLSGGQKQRVALARAVYSEADIYLLDDPLSAVDSHVGKHIFSNVFDENTGLLRGKSRLLVTHAVVFLPKVSEIFVMEKGEITENGSYRELLREGGAFAEFLTKHVQEIDDDEDTDVKAASTEIERKGVVQSISAARKKIPDKSSVAVSGASNLIRAKVEEDLSKLIEEEEASTGNVGIDVYIKYFKSVGIWLTIVGVSFYALAYVASVSSRIWLSKWCTDERATDPNDNSWRNTYIEVYAGLVTVESMSVLTVALVLGFGCLRAARSIHERLLHNVIRLAMSFFDTTPIGRILNRFSNDVNVIDTEIPFSLVFVLDEFFQILAILFVVCYSTPSFFFFVIPIGAAYYFMQTFYIATLRQLRRLSSISLSPIYNHLSETICGQTSIRAFGEVNRFIREYNDRIDHYQAVAYTEVVSLCWLEVRLEILSSVIVLFASFLAVLARGTIEPAIVGLSISYALQVSQVLCQFVSFTSDLETQIVAVERINEYTNCEQEAPWKTVPVDPNWPQKGVVKFENFQVRYREGLDLVLKGINFSVKSQEKIGIVGRTGAGKSSLTLSLFRIIEAAGGKIIIDDINIAEIGLHSLRSQLTIIPQDPVLFSGSLRMNVDPDESCTDDEIWTALEQAHLKRYVRVLAGGLDYILLEGGENLSVGQRQLVCLARALLRKTKILILDEATAAVDIATDELIQKTIRTQFSDCTILTIAHRLNTIMDSDRVLVLDQGQIAEYDTPKALLEKKDSIFYGMAVDFLNK